MRNVTQNALQRAIALLDAIEVGPGRYAYPAHTAQREWRVTSHLSRLAELLAGPAMFQREHYPIEAAQLESVQMPAWWSPEQRYAIRNRIGGIYTVAATMATATTFGTMAGDRVVTADLDTGEEVSA